MNIHGSCHCGNIRFELSMPVDNGVVPVRNCGCSFCVKHGGAWTSHRDAALTAVIEDWSFVSKYRFGTRTADFYVCSKCGVSPFVLSEIERTLYAVVSVNAFDSIEGLSLSQSTSDFDGEETGERLDRRKRNWIPRVSVS